MENEKTPNNVSLEPYVYWGRGYLTKSHRYKVGLTRFHATSREFDTVLHHHGRSISMSGWLNLVGVMCVIR